MNRRGGLAAASWAVLAAVVVTLSARPAPASTMLQGVCPPEVADYPDRGPWPAAARVAPVRVVLALRDRAGLERLIAAQQDPTSAEFAHWREANELADRFGAPRARYERVRAWLRRRGFEVVHDSPLRAAITVAGTTAQVEAAFRVPLRAVTRAGAVLRTPRADPRLPPSLRTDVATIIGLDELTTARPVVGLPAGGFALAPSDFALGYEIAPLFARGGSGAGVTVGVVARSDFAAADVDDFRGRFLPDATGVVRKLFPSATPGIVASAGNVEENEVLLDTQWAGAVAPGATVETVIGSKSGGVLEALESLVEGNRADVLSFSFALCEPETPAGFAAWIDALYAFANAQGQTVVVAAGDGGDHDCPRRSRRAVNVLAASPHAIAVGGTALDLVVDGDGHATAVGDERVWDDASGAGGMTCLKIKEFGRRDLKSTYMRL